MEEIKTFSALIEAVRTNPLVLVYVSTPNCSVCTADFPKVKQIVREENIVSYELNAATVPEAVGQLELFAAPTVLLFYEGKEIHRQGRFLDFQELTYRIQQITTAHSL